MQCVMPKTGLRASSRPMAFSSHSAPSKVMSYVSNKRPAVQRLAVQCQAGASVPGQKCGIRSDVDNRCSISIIAGHACCIVYHDVANEEARSWRPCCCGPTRLVLFSLSAAAAAEAPVAQPAGKPSLHNMPPPQTYAIVEIGGKQMFVEPGKWYTCNRLQVRALAVCWAYAATQQ